MTIQINAGDHVENSERATEYFSNLLENDLGRFTEYLTRVEVHFSDINADKAGPDDKKCVVEARVKNREPIAGTAQDESIEKAFQAALAKVKSSLSKIVDKMQEHR